MNTNTNRLPYHSQPIDTRECCVCDRVIDPVKNVFLGRIWVDREGIKPHVRICERCAKDGWCFVGSGHPIQGGVFASRGPDPDTE